MCRNVTDVDDVLDAAAARAGARYDSFAAVQQFRFDRDMDALGVRRPTHEPRAHNYVAQVVGAGRGAARGRARLRARRLRSTSAAPACPTRAGLDRGDGAASWRAEFGDAAATTRGRDDPLDVAVWRPPAEPGDRAGLAEPVGRGPARAGTPSARRWR